MCSKHTHEKHKNMFFIFHVLSFFDPEHLPKHHKKYFKTLANARQKYPQTPPENRFKESSSKFINRSLGLLHSSYSVLQRSFQGPFQVPFKVICRSFRGLLKVLLRSLKDLLRSLLGPFKVLLR